ncbi:hypothetical protein ACP70R_001727 [Stipagrostis hirtigluma subsp. patula]
MAPPLPLPPLPFPQQRRRPSLPSPACPSLPSPAPARATTPASSPTTSPLTPATLHPATPPPPLQHGSDRRHPRSGGAPAVAASSSSCAPAVAASSSSCARVAVLLPLPARPRRRVAPPPRPRRFPSPRACAGGPLRRPSSPPASQQPSSSQAAAPPISPSGSCPLREPAAAPLPKPPLSGWSGSTRQPLPPRPLAAGRERPLHRPRRLRPLCRRYTLLPRIPKDLADTVTTALTIFGGRRQCEPFLAPAMAGDADVDAEPAFTVIWTTWAARKVFAFAGKGSH